MRKGTKYLLSELRSPQPAPLGPARLDYLMIRKGSPSAVTSFRKPLRRSSIAGEIIGSPIVAQDPAQWKRLIREFFEPRLSLAIAAWLGHRVRAPPFLSDARAFSVRRDKPRESEAPIRSSIAGGRGAKPTTRKIGTAPPRL